MLYDNFMRNKMKNISQYKTATGYPCEFESSKEQELYDYRIYGNNGGVGDKTGNLIDYNTIPTIYNTAGITYVRDRDVITANGTLTSKFSIYTLYKGDGWDKVEPNKTYFVSCGNEVNDGVRRYTLYLFINNKQTGDIVKYASSPGTFILGENDVITYIQLRIYSKTDELFTVENEQFKIMIKEDDGSSEYEPYGYKIPILNNGNLTGTFYIDNPLETNQYAEYKTQSIHRSYGTNEQVELPSITIPQGNVVLTTNTDVEASKISVKYK